MPPFPIARIVVFVLAVAFVTVLLFYGLSGVPASGGGCTTTNFHEATFVPRQK